jgi:ATP phosphoribosyltransferase regulatory subunit
MIFQVLADGPGEPVGAGGRYDELLACFDVPMPATGFALSLDALAWARDQAGLVDAPPPRVVVALAEGAEAVASALRARGVAAVAHAGPDAAAYADAWRFSHVLTERAGGELVLAPAGEPVASGSPEAIAAAVARAIGLSSERARALTDDPR